MKFILMALFVVGSLFGQSSAGSLTTDLKGVTVGTAMGATLSTPTSFVGNIFIAKAVSAVDMFVDIGFNPNTSTGNVNTLLLGTTKTIPVNLTLTLGKHKFTMQPYGIIAYGTALTNTITVAKSLNSTDPNAILTSVSKSALFTQQYGGAFKVKSFKYFDISFGAKVNKTINTNNPALKKIAPYPFVMFSKTF